MKEYIATFHTHLSAMRTQRALKGAGVLARLAPVPRILSTSCGTCVLYAAEEPLLHWMDADVERVLERVSQDGTYCEITRNN